MTLEEVSGEDLHGVRVLRAHGELDVVTTRALLGDPAALTGGGPLVLDLSAATFLDSAGVRLVDRLARECAQSGGYFRVVAPPGSRARRVLEVVGLAGALASDDLPAAVAQVREGTKGG
ncbi:MAG: STAS domain-containing protein [Mycobacteriales bacterium]